MTVEERQMVFLHALLTECSCTLNRTIGFSQDPECTRLISAACDALDKAKDYNERKVNEITDWDD